jgi:hypothetical protein
VKHPEIAEEVLVPPNSESAEKKNYSNKLVDYMIYVVPMGNGYIIAKKMSLVKIIRSPTYMK